MLPRRDDDGAETDEVQHAPNPFATLSQGSRPREQVAIGRLYIDR